MKKLSESAWGDMMRRGSGENIRTEDDVNLLDFDGLYDYIKSRYDKKVFYLDKTWYKEIYVDVLANISLILKPNDKGGLLHVLLSWSKEKISMPFFDKLSERFKVEHPSVNRRIIKEKDGTCTNQTYIDVIDFFLDNIDNMLVTESAWGDMMRRGSGEVTRREDDVNHMDFDTFADYIKDNYSEKGNWFAIRESDDGKSRHIEIDIISGIGLSFNVVEGELYNILVQGNKNHVDIPGLKEIFNVNVLGSSTFGVVEKDWSKSNNTFVKLIEFYLKKKTNESAWGDMMRRGSGEVIRSEDDINNFGLEELCNYLRSNYESITPYDTTIYVDDGYLTICLFEDTAGYLRYLYYDESHITTQKDVFELLDCERELKQNYWIQLKTNRFGFEIVNIYPKNQAERSVSNTFFIEVLDFILDRVDSPLKKQIEKKNNMNESAWGDMMRRGSGEEVRGEDTDFLNSVKSDIRFFAIDIVYADLYKNSIDGFKEFMSKSYKNNFYDSKTHKNVGKKMVKDIVIYVEANWNKGKNYESQVNEEINKEEEKVKKLGFVKEPGKSIEKTLNDWWDSYPYKEDLMNEVNLDLTGEEKYDDPDDMWNDSDYLTQIETYLKEKGVNESAWGDMMKRGSGEDNRIEDEVLSDKEINSLNQFTLMYCREERAHYIQNHIVPPPPSGRKENDYEGLIKYIEDRRDENLFTNVGDYNKIISYIKKNWDRLDMDTYIKKWICSPDVMKGNRKIVECEGIPGGATPANVGGMGAAYFPGPNGEPGSGDLPSPTGIVYHQVAPYTTFLKQIKKKKKKTKKFRKEDEPCVHSPNAKVYDYVDDFRDYVDRTYNNINRI